MPELPEVETTRLGLAPLITGHCIQKTIVRQPKLRWPVDPKLPNILRHQTIQTLSRRSKYLLAHCDNGSLIIHLGMSGRLRFVDCNTPAEKHDHIDIIFKHGLLRYQDPRRFGSVIWSNNPNNHPLLQSLGPEPLSTAFNAKDFHTAIKTRRASIKSLLMNASIVVGVGNIYANESLFLSKIHPELPGNQLTLKQCTALVAATKKILQQAIKQGGTTLKDFISADGKPGYFQQSLQVYNRGGAPCTRCQHSLTSYALHQRQTVYCPSCQPLPKPT